MPLKKSDSTFNYTNYKDPKNYDWKRAFSIPVSEYNKTKDEFTSFETTRLIGLILYAEELEQETKYLKEEVKDLTAEIKSLNNTIEIKVEAQRNQQIAEQSEQIKSLTVEIEKLKDQYKAVSELDKPIKSTKKGAKVGKE